MIDCVVSPVDQTFPVVAEEVNTTLPPRQNVVGPSAVIVGKTAEKVEVIVWFAFMSVKV
ncbi:hypothetical protein D3C80_1144290 [compost metagenome]